MNSETLPSTKTLLFVDDEPLMVDLFRDYMTMRGFFVLTASDAIEALKRVAEAEPSIDLVITDMTMPGMDGLELAQQLLATSPQLSVLLTTGHDRLAMEVTLPSNIVGVVTKPYQNRVMAEKIRDILARKSS